MENRFFRLRSSIAIVRNGDFLEFFDSNLRTAFSISIGFEGVVELLQEFNGSAPVGLIARRNPHIDLAELCELAAFLHNKYVFIEVDCAYPDYFFEKLPRTVNMLESFFNQTSTVCSAVGKASDANVLIVGLGAVGSWVLHGLVKAGVQKITVMDDDVVDESNLHRQDLFYEADIGHLKVDCARRNVADAYGINVSTVCRKLQSVVDLINLPDLPTLIINCADFPSVDHTSRIVSDFCLSNRIPHIIGGGYNLHLTLVGQIVIPGYSACFHCFDQVLSRVNSADLVGVRKLSRDFRKIGSIGPVCGVSAAITLTEVLKLVFSVPLSFVSLINKRLEFSLDSFDFSSLLVERDLNCSFCSASDLGGERDEVSSGA